MENVHSSFPHRRQRAAGVGVGMGRLVMNFSLRRMWVFFALLAIFHVGAAPVVASSAYASMTTRSAAHRAKKCPCCVEDKQDAKAVASSVHSACLCHLEIPTPFVAADFHALPVQFDVWMPLGVRPLVSSARAEAPCVWRPRNNSPPRSRTRLLLPPRAPPALFL